MTPALVELGSLRWFSGIVTVLWALEFYFYQRLLAFNVAGLVLTGA